GPAILIELGFISNDRDRTELLDTEVRATVCATIADVLQARLQPAIAPSSPVIAALGLTNAFAAAAATPASSGTYRLPAYARDTLGPGSGVPWDSARQLPAFNFYKGIVANSFHFFGTQAVFYECKFDIDNDGVGGNQGGDPNHQSDTSLHDAADV